MMKEDSINADDVKKLSDFQLYSLFYGKELSPFLKRTVADEFKNRNFSIETLDKLGMEYEKRVGNQSNGLPLYQKILIVLIPFFPVINAILANRHISKKNMRRWKDYWNYVALGYVLWTGVILLLAKLVLFK